MPRSLSRLPSTILTLVLCLVPSLAWSQAGAEESAPILEESAPILEESTPILEESTPILEESTPILEESTPILGETEPSPEAEADAPSGRTEAELAEALAAADDAWFFGNYLEVIRVLNPLLLPEPDPGLRREQLLEAYELLGASLHFQYGGERSREAFVRLLYLEPDYELDPFVFPASMLEYFDQLRLEHAEALDEIRRQRQGAQLDGQLFIGRTVEKRSIIVSMIPFGVGLYLNDEPGWATFYLASEVLLGGLSMAMYLANEAARNDNGFYDDADAARTRQAIQVGAGIAFFVVLTANIIHGAAIHEDVVETSYEILETPPEDFFAPTVPRAGVYWEIYDEGWSAGIGWAF